jgi:hypothetical protein
MAGAMLVRFSDFEGSSVPNFKEALERFPEHGIVISDEARWNEGKPDKFPDPDKSLVTRTLVAI